MSNLQTNKQTKKEKKNTHEKGEGSTKRAIRRGLELFSLIDRI